MPSVERSNLCTRTEIENTKSNRRGDDMKTKTNKSVMFWMDSEQHKELKALAVEKDTDVAHILRKLVSDYLKKQGKAAA